MNVPLKILTDLADGFPTDDEVLRKPERYHGDLWRATFVGTDASPASHGRDDDVAWLLESYPSALSRDQILGIDHPDPGTRSRRILIASLMWGYGTGGLRFRGMVDIAALLADGSLNERLIRCHDGLGQGDVRSAYSALTEIRGIGSAFFTKFLYFLGRSLDADPEYPLILDTRVAESLAWLTGYRELVAAESYRPMNDPESYAAYVATMHRWARHLRTTADAIEFYLWHPPKTSFQSACRRHHASAAE